MRPRDWFSVGVRLFGLWVFYRGFADLLTLGTLVMGISPSATIDRGFGEGASTASNYYLWYAAGYFALAAYLLLGADHLTRWLFDEPHPSPPTAPIDPHHQHLMTHHRSLTAKKAKGSPSFSAGTFVCRRARYRRMA